VTDEDLSVPKKTPLVRKGCLYSLLLLIFIIPLFILFRVNRRAETEAKHDLVRRTMASLKIGMTPAQVEQKALELGWKEDAIGFSLGGDSGTLKTPADFQENNWVIIVDFIEGHLRAYRVGTERSYDHRPVGAPVGDEGSENQEGK
jgi:hypothetical protein